MIVYEDIKAIHDSLIEAWGEKGKEVFFACWRAPKFNGTLENFLDHCVAQGGNWGGMLLSGVKALYPEVWEAIPDNMGHNAFCHITNILVLLGVSPE